MKLTQFTPDIFNKIILVYKKVLGAHNRFVVDDALGELKNSGKFIFSQGGDNWIYRLVFSLQGDEVTINFEYAKRYATGRFKEQFESKKEEFEKEIKKLIEKEF